MTGEISYDLVMKDDMGFVEGTFRLPGGPWQVILVSKGRIPSPEVYPATWASGVTGLEAIVPDDTRLNRMVVESLLGQAVGVGGWVVSTGPNSMALR